MRQLLDGGFQFPQQSVVRFNLPIQFTAVGDNALFLHSPCHHTFVDGGLLDQTSLGMTAVVDTGIVSVSFQIAVGYVCPCLAPYDKLFLAVPTFGDGILSAELGAFRVLVGSFISVFLRFGWRHIHLFSPTLYGYCFSHPSACAALNSAAVKPRSSPFLTQRYSFSVLYCQLPCLSRGHTVSIIWA